MFVIRTPCSWTPGDVRTIKKLNLSKSYRTEVVHAPWEWNGSLNSGREKTWINLWNFFKDTWGIKLHWVSRLHLKGDCLNWKVIKFITCSDALFHRSADPGHKLQANVRRTSKNRRASVFTKDPVVKTKSPWHAALCWEFGGSSEMLSCASGDIHQSGLIITDLQSTLRR